MTMRPTNEPQNAVPVLNPTSRYSFTWPGQPPKIVSGAELAAICKGADHTMLNITEVSGSTSSFDEAPDSEPLRR